MKNNKEITYILIKLTNITGFDYSFEAIKALEQAEEKIISEVSFAVAEREKEIVEMIEKQPNATRNEAENEKVICSEDIINLINKQKE
jgi:hypothetical protein